MARETMSNLTAVALRGSSPKGGFAPQGDGLFVAESYSAARLAALENFFSTRSRFSFDR